jgi:hypothetical protein
LLMLFLSAIIDDDVAPSHDLTLSRHALCSF